MKFNFLDPVEFSPRSDCYIAAATLGAGALSAGASIFGSNKAAKAQQQAAQAAIAAQQQMFAQAKGEVQPFIDAGKSMIPGLQGWLDPTNSGSPLASLMRLTTPGSDMTAALEQTPGFQFSNTYGQKAVQNALAARGLGGPGGALARGGADYAEGLAGNTWQNVVNSLLSTFQAGGTGMQNLVNTGSGAASSLMGGSNTAAGNIGQNMVGMGNAQAAGAMGMANGIGQFGNSISTAAILNKLMPSGSGSAGLYGNIGDAGTSGSNVMGTGGYNYLDNPANWR